MELGRVHGDAKTVGYGLVGGTHSKQPKNLEFSRRQIDLTIDQDISWRRRREDYIGILTGLNQPQALYVRQNFNQPVR